MSKKRLHKNSCLKIVKKNENIRRKASGDYKTFSASEKMGKSPAPLST